MTAIIKNNDTIAAIATPIGEGGISVIRICGPTACKTIDKIFKGKIRLADAITHTVHFGIILGKDNIPIDQVIATVFSEKNSYTGEETVELSCHGGMYVTEEILNTVIATGCRFAEPGEFTKRAFLNGKIDLVQAEAVADLIYARNELSRRNSIEQIQGYLSNEIKNLKSELLKICGLLELELDFTEEDIELAKKEDIKEFLEKTINKIKNLIESFKEGRIYREGVKTAIIGKTNTGKSSLLNKLLKEDRAIVSHIAGTTRDTIEENITINGLLFSLTDTAGLRIAEDEIEYEGINRTKKMMKKADLLLYLVESVMSEDELKIEFGEYKKIKNEFKNAETIFCINKIDLITDKKISGLKEKFKDSVQISVKNEIGLNELKSIMVKKIKPGGNESSLVITNSRHRNILQRTKERLLISLESLKTNKGNELIVIDIRAALDIIGELIGETTSEDILNEIFSRFCIGK